MQHGLNVVAKSHNGTLMESQNRNWLLKILTKHSKIPILFFFFMPSPWRPTCHWTEAEALFPIKVVGGPAPLHAVLATISGAVGVVAAVVEVGELTQGAVGVSTAGRHQNYTPEHRTKAMLRVPKTSRHQDYLQHLLTKTDTRALNKM